MRDGDRLATEQAQPAQRDDRRTIIDQQGQGDFGTGGLDGQMQHPATGALTMGDRRGGERAQQFDFVGRRVTAAGGVEALAGVAAQIAFKHQFLHGLTHRDARDAVMLDQFALGGELGARRQGAIGQGGQDAVLELLIERLRIVSADAFGHIGNNHGLNIPFA